MHCNDVLEQVSAALDGENSTAQRSALEDHLASCPRCAALYQELAGQSRLLHALDCDVPEDLSARILSALPPQTPAKKSSVIRLRRWGTLAACLVLVCCGAFALSRPAAESKAAMDVAVKINYTDADFPAEFEVGLVTPAESQAVEAQDASAETVETVSLIRAIRFERIDWAEELTPSAVLLTAEEAADRLSPEADLSSARYILVTLTEPSGSVSHTVEDVVLTEYGSCEVVIRREVPETGTCDMAAWHIFIEVEPVFPEDTPITLTVQ